MLIARCAWHRRYYGIGRLLGVASWRGLHIGFTDGICPKCAARVRSDFRLSRAGGRVAADRAGWMPGIAVVVVAVMAAVLLIARPTHDQILTSAPPGPRVVETDPAASPALVIPPALDARPEVVPPPGVIREPHVALAAPARYVPARQGNGAGRHPSRALALHRSAQREFSQSP
jgi:hypothetical protein